MLTQLSHFEGDFIRQFIADHISNPYLGDSLYVAVMLFVAFLLTHVVRFIITLIEKYITQATETDLDDKILELINKSIFQLLYILAFYFSFQEVKDNFSEKAQNIAIGTSFSIIIFLICLFFSRLVTVLTQWFKETVASKTETDIDNEFAPLVERLLKIVVYVIGAAVVLNYFKIDLTGLAIFATAVSFAFGYASQDTLANMISGFVIMVDRPFRVGDRIKLVASNQTGDVVSIGLRSTKILNFDNHFVVIPNSEIAKSQLINLSYPDPASRIKIDLGVAYGTDIELVKKLLVEIATSHSDVLKDPEPKSFFLDFKDSYLSVTLVCRVANYKDEFRVSEELRMEINKKFTEKNIEIPFPQHVIHMKGDK